MRSTVPTLGHAQLGADRDACVVRCRRLGMRSAIPAFGHAIRWRTDHHRERRIRCAERLERHFRICTRTRGAAGGTRRQTAAVPYNDHEVAAETAERTCLTGLAGTRGAVPGDPFSVCRGMAGEEHEVRSGGVVEEMTKKTKASYSKPRRAVLSAYR